MSGDTGSTSFLLNGISIAALPGETILQAARRHGIAIPHLCYKDGMRPDGNCRACVVEIKGERVLAPSCCRTPAPGMEVSSMSPRAAHSQRLVLELLLADAPDEDFKPGNNELLMWAEKCGARRGRFPARTQPAADGSHPAMAVNLAACIQCTRCVRACREEQVNDVIGYAQRGAAARIVFDFDDPMGRSTCVACGECVQACPTGALAPAHDVYSIQADAVVPSVCPYCGVGCQISYHTKDNGILRVEGRDGPANHERLCVKGRFGFDYVRHPQRLTQPLLRKPSVPKHADATVDPLHWQDVFRPATWDEALDAAAGGLTRIRAAHGPDALAGFGSAKGSNEEAYLFQKLVRTGFGGNNVDHCTRLCHASSVAALLEGIGSGAVSNQVADVAHAEVVFLIGSNPTVNHPVAATWIKNAVHRGLKLIVADPRRTPIARHAWRYLHFRADTDLALLNAMVHTIIAEDLVDHAFVRARTTGFDALAANVRRFTPEAMAPVCGIDAETIREVARAYARSRASMILWGMGISQHVHGTDNARCLIALALLTGQIGRPGTGLHPLRGQNNVQGASDAGLIPLAYPDYRRVDDPAAQARFAAFWGTSLDPRVGLTAVEIINAAYEGRIRGMLIMGENPAMSDPNLHHARAGLARLEHLVVQDLFLTETAYMADVVLPASAWPEKTGTVTNTDRRVQLGHRALAPPGDARQDLWILQELARRLGLNWDYRGPDSGVAQVYEEMRQAMDSIAGITWDRLQRESSVTYPCGNLDDPGQPVVFTESFPTGDGLGKFVPTDLLHAAELPDADYPFVLITGRELEHWHTGSMTRRAAVLDALEPEATVAIHPDDLSVLGVHEGDVVTVASRRGQISLRVRSDDGMPRGAVFIPFAFHEAAANLLTTDALDPFGKIAEVKYCAVRVTAGGSVPASSGY